MPVAAKSFWSLGALKSALCLPPATKLKETTRATSPKAAAVSEPMPDAAPPEADGPTWRRIHEAFSQRYETGDFYPALVDVLQHAGSTGVRHGCESPPDNCPRPPAFARQTAQGAFSVNDWSQRGER